MYDALLIVSFGGPEGPEDVLPFLENVTRGKNVPRERLLEVAEHYYHFGGKSPLNDQCRDLIQALRSDFDSNGIPLPIYWGNRNWHPFLAATLDEMRRDGVKRALAFVTSAYSSYSGCRQYRENIRAAQIEAGDDAPEVHKLRAFYNHPAFIEACGDRVRDALRRFDQMPRVVVTAHSIPESMARTCDYEKQLRETARLVCEALGIGSFDLVYQSRSGPPNQPWLGPDILNHLRELHERGIDDVLIAPLGFLSDHMEVLYDLDHEALQLASELNMNVRRAATVGTHAAFVRMIRQLVRERLCPGEERLAIGPYGPSHDFCAEDCCPAPSR
ncbi:MAG: ferrochelatase, partial [Acidobacteriaceae bacterium]|nr:ferrochelatase [Acidobacteriaceae bacterium]